MLMSVGVATPGSTGTLRAWHQPTTAGSNPGATTYCAPARMACSACSTVSTVPAPISSSRQVLLMPAMASAAAGVRNVTSAQPMPPSRSALASGTASRGLSIVITGTRPILLNTARASAMALLLDSAGCRVRSPRSHRTAGRLDGVDRRQWGVAGQHAYHLTGSEVPHCMDRLFGVVRRMRRNDYVVEAEEGVHRFPVAQLGRFLGDVVQPRAGDPAFAQRPAEGRVVDDGPAGGVDEDSARLHALELSFPDQVLRLCGEGRLDHQVIRLLDQFAERYWRGTVRCDVGVLHVRVIRDDPHAEARGPGRDRPGDGPERQQPQRASPQAMDRLAGLPAPDPGAGGVVVVAELARHGQRQGHGVVGDLVLAPVIGDIRHQDVAAGGRVHIHDVDTCAVAGDDPAAGEGIDRPGAHVRVLRDDRVGVPGDADHVVFRLALRGDQLEARALYDRPLDAHVVIVVVGDDYRAFLIFLHVPLDS